MTLQQKTTIAAEYLARLIGQFQGKPTIAALLQALLDQVQALENAAFEVLEETTLDNSIGAQLDGIGRIVGADRGGLSDADYLAEINARIIVNTSGGTTEEILAIYELLKANVSGVGVLTSDYPAGFVLDLESGAETNGEAIARLVLRAKGAGIRGNVRWFEAAPPFLFNTPGQGFNLGKLTRSRSD